MQYFCMKLVQWNDYLVSTVDTDGLVVLLPTGTLFCSMTNVQERDGQWNNKYLVRADSRFAPSQ